MPKIESERKSVLSNQYEFPKYTNEELKELEKKLDFYKITNIRNGDKGESFYNEEKFFKDNFVLTEDGAVKITGYITRYNSKGEPYVFCDYPSAYEILKDKIQQLYKFQGRRQYAIKMNELETNSLIKNIDVENETDLENILDFQNK